MDMDLELTEVELEALNKLVEDVEKLNQQWKRMGKFMEESMRIQSYKAEKFDKEFDRRMSMIEDKLRGLQTSNRHPENEGIDSQTPSVDPSQVREPDTVAKNTSTYAEDLCNNAEELSSSVLHPIVSVAVESSLIFDSTMKVVVVDVIEDSDYVALCLDSHPHFALANSVATNMDTLVYSSPLRIHFPLELVLNEAGVIDQKETQGFAYLFCALNSHSSSCSPSVCLNADMDWSSYFDLRTNLICNQSYILSQKKKVRFHKPPAKPPDDVVIYAATEADIETIWNKVRFANPVIVASSGVLYMDLYCCISGICQIDPMKISSYPDMLCHLKEGQNTLCERTSVALKLASLNKPPPLPPEIEKGYRGCSGQTSMISNHAYLLESELHASKDFGMIALDASGMHIQGLSLRQNLDVHQLAALLSTHAQLESPFLGVLILTKTRVIDVSAYANKNHSTGINVIDFILIHGIVVDIRHREVYYAANLVTWLYCLARIEFIDEDGCLYVVCTTFVQFLESMRKLHMNCCLASAGSHRVWGFSEYNSISFLFQSPQLFDHNYMKLKSIHTAYISRKFAQKYLYLPYADIEMKVKKRLLTEHLSLPGCEFYPEQRQCQICIAATPILGFTLQLHNRNGIAVSKPFTVMIVVVKCVKGICLNSLCFNLWLNKYGIRQCLSTFSTLILQVEELHYDFSCMSYKLWKKQLSELVKTLVRNGVNSGIKFACEARWYLLLQLQDVRIELCDDYEFLVPACDESWDCMSSQQLGSGSLLLNVCFKAYRFDGDYDNHGTQAVWSGEAKMVLAVARLFKRGNDILRFDILDLSQNGTKGKLNSEVISQPTITSLVAGQLCGAREGGRVVVDSGNGICDLSLVEYTAVVVAEAFNLEDGLVLLKMRGDATHNASFATQSVMDGGIKLDSKEVQLFGDSTNKEIVNSYFGLEDHVFLVRYINNFFMFSLPRPPEIANLEDKVKFKGEGILRIRILCKLRGLICILMKCV